MRRSAAVDGILELMLLREPNIVVARAQVACSIAAQSRETHSCDEILVAFTTRPTRIASAQRNTTL